MFVGFFLNNVACFLFKSHNDGCYNKRKVFVKKNKWLKKTAKRYGLIYLNLKI